MRAAVLLPAALALPLLLPSSPALASASFRVDPADSSAWFGDGALALHFDRHLNFELFSVAAVDSAESLSVTAPLPPPGAANPPETLTADSAEVRDLGLTDWARAATVTPLADPFFGTGSRLTLTAVSASRPIALILSVEIYDAHPDAALLRARWANTGAVPLSIQRIRQARLVLDLRRAEPAMPPYGFLVLQPTIDAWGDNWIGAPLAPGYSRVNPLMGGDLYGRGGMPFTDLWGPRTGIALGSVEPVPTALEFPCRVLGDGRVEIAVDARPAASFGEFPLSLAPGDTLDGPRTALITHRGDFYDAAARWGRLLDCSFAAAGRDTVGPYPASAYEPYWKTWGFGRDFTTAEIYALLDELADLGFARVGLDDGWFTTYGGWAPDPAKFPGGESGLRAFLADLHTARWGSSHNRAFEAMLWWDPTGWEPASGLSTSLLVQDSTGGYPEDDRHHPYLCPAYAPAENAILAMVDRFMGNWGVDALYMDGGGLLNVPPCYNPLHHHARPAESCERLPDLFRAIHDRARAWRPGGTLILCECSTPHDPYKRPYYDQEDASDPITDRMVRWKAKFMRAVRGGEAPIGDGYVDPMSYNDLSGTFANGLGVGAILTSMYTSQDDLGRGNWATWGALDATARTPLAAYRNLYNLGFETPEGHALEWADGSMLFSFASDTFTSGPITLRGLAPGVQYALTELDTGRSRGTVTGPTATLTIPFHTQALGKPWWLLISAAPPASSSSIPPGPSGRGDPRTEGVLQVSPNPARGEVSLAVALPAPASEPPRLLIYDVRGRVVRELPLPASATARVTWDGLDLASRPAASGLYIARLSWSGGAAVRRILLVR